MEPTHNIYNEKLSRSINMICRNVGIDDKGKYLEVGTVEEPVSQIGPVGQGALISL